MKTFSYLKFIVSAAFVFLLIGWVINLGAFVFMIFGGNVELTAAFLPDGTYLSRSQTTAVIFYAVQLSFNALFLYAVYVIKKLIGNLEKGSLYSRFQIASLNLIGYLIVLVTCLDAFLDFMINIIFNYEIGIKLSFNSGFGSFWFVISTGLFFIFLSKVFENARRLREESELTV